MFKNKLAMKEVNEDFQTIQDALIRVANGNFNSGIYFSEGNDEQLYSVQVGINMLAEELK